MTPDDLKALIDTYGADLGKWPSNLRAAATLYRDESDVARAILNEAEAFEALLKTPEPVLSARRRASLVDSIMARLDPP